MPRFRPTIRQARPKPAAPLRGLSPAFRLLSFCLVHLALCIPVATADQYPRQPGIDVRHYVFRLELRNGTNAIRGEAEINLLFRADGVEEVFLDFVGVKAGAATGMRVSAVADDSGAGLDFAHEGDRLRIRLGKPAGRGERRRITVRYEGVPADGLLIGPNKHGEPVFFGDNFPDRARHWLPVLDHPADKASCEFEVTAPEAYQVVAPGALVETYEPAGESAPDKVPGGRAHHHLLHGDRGRAIRRGDGRERGRGDRPDLGVPAGT